MAAEPDPYFALPALYGAPAYARPRVVPESERSIDTDDLPIEACQTPDERLLARTLQASGAYRPNGNGMQSGGASHEALPPAHGASGQIGGRRFNLRALTDRLGSLNR